ncbi:MAG: phosphoribosylformylglycinamidine synthase subunit PurQ [Bacteroidota bacterium]|nr:phosphoribosylformylglycinamidine synthase subunit PurQ [Bacteroidota bacterium]
MAPVRFGIVVFPGSNCDHDAYYAVKHVLGADAVFLWHRDTTLRGVDVVILPGGFSYGDYLRCGAIARFSPIMKEVVRFAKAGGFVMGICNGFQILCESGLLPGSLLRNASLRFVCRMVHIRTERAGTAFTRLLAQGQVLTMPVAHGEGNYYTDASTLAGLEAKGQVLFRYSTLDGQVTPGANPNGSLRNIAGVMNEEGNVFGLMPHPERAMEHIIGSVDGAMIFRSVLEAVTQRAPSAVSKE